MYSPENILSAAFPRVQQQLIKVLSKFTLIVDFSVEKKNLKPNYDTFPHNYSVYNKCVHDFIDIARFAPDASIKFLLTKLLPNDQPSIYLTIKSKLGEIYKKFNDIFDLILELFFIDCVVQILPVSEPCSLTTELLERGYKAALQFENKFESPLRYNIVKQYSVLFSKISHNSLVQVLSGFSEKFTSKMDPRFFFILHRFVRLSISDQVTIETITKFLEDFLNCMNKKNSSAYPEWVSSLLCLIPQFLNIEESPLIYGAIKKIYDFVNKKGENSLEKYLMLSTCLVRMTKDPQPDFLEQMLKNKKLTLLIKLKVFLNYIHGPHFSRSAQNWEWGETNLEGYPGIEASYLFKPDQNQSENNSFTFLFLEYILPKANNASSEEIELIGDILYNLACRDFVHFRTRTVPLLGENNMASLLKCIKKILNPEQHFIDWISLNPRNNDIPLNDEVNTLLSYVKKEHLFTLAKLRSVQKSQLETKFIFDLIDSNEAPLFTLPLEAETTSIPTKERIIKSTSTIQLILKEWNNDYCSQNSSIPSSDHFTIDQISPAENLFLEVLEVLIQVINDRDINEGPFLNIIFDAILSSTLAISIYSIKALNYLYVSQTQARFRILSSFFDRLQITTSIEEAFVLLEFLIKLFDLSLEVPGIEGESMTKFIQRGEYVLLYLLAFPSPEVRDLTLLCVERLNRFTDSFESSVSLYYLLTELSLPLSEAVKYRIRISGMESSKSLLKTSKGKYSNSLITVQQAATSVFTKVFISFYAEIASQLTYLWTAEDLLYEQKLIINTLFRLKKHDEFYYNLVILLSNLFPVLPKLIESKFKSNHNSSILTAFYYTDPSTPFENKIYDEFDLQYQNLMEILIDISFDPEALYLFENLGWRASAVFIFHLQKLSPQDAALFLLKFSVDPNFNLSLDASNFVKNVVLSIIISLQDSLKNVKESIQTNLDQLLLYVKLFDNFVSALIEPQKECKIGPIRAPVNILQQKSLLTLWPIEKRQEAFSILYQIMNYSPEIILQERTPSNKPFIKSGSLPPPQIKFNTGSELPENQLINQNLNISFIDAMKIISKTCLINLVKISPLFTETYPFNSSIKNFYLSIEKENIHVFKFILQHCFYLIPLFFDEIYRSDESNASYFFLALCSLFNDPNVEEALPSSEPLSEDDQDYINLLITILPDILPLAFVNLVNKSSKLRSYAFGFLKRISPILFTILSKNQTKEADTSLSESSFSLEKYNSLFMSSYATISRSNLIDVIADFANHIPQIAQKYVKSAFLHLLGYSQNQSFKQQSKSKSPIFSQDNIIIVLESAFLFCEKLNLSNINDGIPPALQCLTSFSLMDLLLDLINICDISSMPIYLKIWISFIDDLDIILNFLIEHSKSKPKEVKIILVQFAQEHPTTVIKLIATHLRFSSWFNSLSHKFKFDYSEAVSHYKSEEKNTTNSTKTNENPTQNDFSLFKEDNECLLMTLTDLANTLKDGQRSYFDKMRPFLNIILSYTYLLYDPSVFLYQDMLNTIINSLGHLNPSDFDLNKITWEQHLIAFISNMSSQFKEAFGKEIMYWACGCGNLEISQRALFIFSQLSLNLGQEQLNMILLNIGRLTACKESPRIVSYIETALKLFAKVLTILPKDIIPSSIKNTFPSSQPNSTGNQISRDDTSNEELSSTPKSNEEQIESFQKPFLLPISKIFLNIGVEQCLTKAALTVLTQYIITSNINSSDIGILLKKVIPLFATIRPRHTIIGFILSIFKHFEENKRQTHFSIVSLIVLLPLIYEAYAAYHNIPPYFVEIPDESIILYLQAGLLFSKSQFFSQNLISVLQSLKNPSSTTLKGFFISISAALTSESIKTASPFLVAMAKSASKYDPILLQAIFAVVGELIDTDSCDFLPNIYPIVEIAASRTSPASSSLLEVYIKRVPEMIRINTNDVRLRNLVVKSWKDIGENVKKCLEKLQISQVHLEPISSLNNLIAMIPLVEEGWDLEKDERMEFSSVKIKPFYEQEEAYKKACEDTVDESNQLIDISLSSEDYMNISHE